MSGKKSLPIRRAQFDVQGFLAFAAEQGAEIGTPTNPYEVVRYKAYWRGTQKAATHVVYAKENGLLTWTGGSKGHYRAFIAGAPMDELPRWEPVTKAETAKRGASARHRKASREALIERDGTDCWFCGRHMADDDRTIEHLVPQAAGGRNTLANYALAHARCNQLAADKPLVEKLALRSELREQYA